MPPMNPSFSNRLSFENVFRFARLRKCAWNCNRGRLAQSWASRYKWVRQGLATTVLITVWSSAEHVKTEEGPVAQQDRAADS